MGINADYRREPLELSINNVIEVGHQTGRPQLDGARIRVGRLQVTLTVHVEVRGQVALMPPARVASTRVIHKNVTVIQTVTFDAISNTLLNQVLSRIPSPHYQLYLLLLLLYLLT